MTQQWQEMARNVMQGRRIFVVMVGEEGGAEDMSNDRSVPSEGSLTAHVDVVMKVVRRQSCVVTSATP
jgi:hypothetical protein